LVSIIVGEVNANVAVISGMILGGDGGAACTPGWVIQVTR